MIKSTLCYIENNGNYLMLYRNKKENDPNAGKWIGVGGKLEPGETPDECVAREVVEETGLTGLAFTYRGLVHFRSDVCEDEEMYLYTAELENSSELSDCNEGELAWISRNEILGLPMWEGDKYFLEVLLRDDEIVVNRDRETDCCPLLPFEITLTYQGDKLVEVGLYGLPGVGGHMW